jgi:DNA uptake protein ComE-like DNA-binding protein
LMKVHGIGEGLSARILKEKEKFGSFASMDQMIDVWGLNEEVVKNLNKYFKIITVPSELKKIKINEANVKTLMTFPYFRYQIAKEIVIYRSANGDFSNIEDLTKIKGFPVDKLKIIALYLEF